MRIFAGVPRVGASKKGGVGKTSYFLALCVDISKMVRDTTKVTNGSSIICAFDWHKGRWPWMTLKIFSEFCATLHFCEAYIYQGCRVLTFALARLSCLFYLTVSRS